MEERRQLLFTFEEENKFFEEKLGTRLRVNELIIIVGCTVVWWSLYNNKTTSGWWKKLKWEGMWYVRSHINESSIGKP